MPAAQLPPNVNRSIESSIPPISPRRAPTPGTAARLLFRKPTPTKLRLFRAPAPKTPRAGRPRRGAVSLVPSRPQGTAGVGCRARSQRNVVDPKRPAQFVFKLAARGAPQQHFQKLSLLSRPDFGVHSGPQMRAVQAISLGSNLAPGRIKNLEVDCALGANGIGPQIGMKSVKLPSFDGDKLRGLAKIEIYAPVEVHPQRSRPAMTHRGVIFHGHPQTRVQPPTEPTVQNVGFEAAVEYQPVSRWFVRHSANVQRLIPHSLRVCRAIFANHFLEEGK